MKNYNRAFTVEDEGARGPRKVTLYTCEECGCIVANKNKHDNVKCKVPRAS